MTLANRNFHRSEPRGENAGRYASVQSSNPSAVEHTLQSTGMKYVGALKLGHYPGTETCLKLSANRDFTDIRKVNVVTSRTNGRTERRRHPAEREFGSDLESSTHGVWSPHQRGVLVENPRDAPNKFCGHDAVQRVAGPADFSEASRAVEAGAGAGAMQTRSWCV